MSEKITSYWETPSRLAVALLFLVGCSDKPLVSTETAAYINYKPDLKALVVTMLLNRMSPDEAAAYTVGLEAGCNPVVNLGTDGKLNPKTSAAETIKKLLDSNPSTITNLVVLDGLDLGIRTANEHKEVCMPVSTEEFTIPQQ